jgi:hypothetical protein
MCQFKLRHYVVTSLALISTVFLIGCTPTNVAYRTYYQDAQCRLFYVDMNGNRVYESGVVTSKVDMRMCYRDASGRLYYQDSFGNRFYKERVCR